MKLSAYAKKLGITYRTAWNHFKNGQIPNAYALPTGTIIVPQEATPVNLQPNTKRACIYARVSSSQNKTNLNSQAKRLEQYCQANGWQVVRTVKEIASGLNDKRPKLADIIQKIHQYDVVVVEHKDRLTRTGFHYFNLFAPNKFHVVNEAANDAEDLMNDLVAIITSFCAKLYGLRKGRRKTEKIIQELQAAE